MLQGKDFIALANAFHHLFRPICMGVTYEQLPKAIIIDQSYDLTDPGLIQLIKNIVQEQDGCGSCLFFYEVELCKF